MTTVARSCGIGWCPNRANSRASDGLCRKHHSLAIHGHPMGTAPTVCLVGSCKEPPISRSYCNFHYYRLAESGTGVKSAHRDRGSRNPINNRDCLIPDCRTPAQTLGMCKAHANWCGKYKFTPIQAVMIFEHPVCALCQRNMPQSGINVDHDHSCCPGQSTCGNCVRGVLCRACNRGLGSFGDDVGVLRKAVRYLERFESVAARLEAE